MKILVVVNKGMPGGIVLGMKALKPKARCYVAHETQGWHRGRVWLVGPKYSLVVIDGKTWPVFNNRIRLVRRWLGWGGVKPPALSEWKEVEKPCQT